MLSMGNTKTYFLTKWPRAKTLVGRLFSSKTALLALPCITPSWFHLSTSTTTQSSNCFFGDNKNITIFSHSASDSLAVALAKLPTIEILIFFGCPCKRLDFGEDQRRINSFQFVQMPYLIAQGNRTKYDGCDVKDYFPLAEKIEFAMISSDHQYDHLENT